MACLLTGCAAYQVRSLKEKELDQALAVPPPAILERAVAQFQHPRLAPVKVDLSKPLTDEAVGILAVLVSPDLKALRAKNQVAAAQVFDAGLLPDPKLSVSLDFPLSGPSSLVSGYSAGVQWHLAKLATRGTDRRIAKRHAEQVRYDVAWQEWLVANQARLLARRLVYLRRQQRLAQQAAAVAEHLLNLTRQNVQAGYAKLTDLSLRQTAFLDAKDRSLALARQAEQTRQQLNGLIGLPPEQEISLAEITPSPMPNSDPNQLFARARRQRLDLLALRAGYASQEAAVYRAILGQYPAFSLGLSENRDTSAIHSGGPGFSFDLPLFNRNRGTIAIARASREQLYQEYVARLQQTRADIAALVADLERIAAEIAPLAQEVPKLARAEQVLREAAAGGDVTQVEYQVVRANYLDKQLKLLNLRQAAAEDQISLQLAIGLPLLP